MTSLPFGGDRTVPSLAPSSTALRVRGEEIHREVDALEIAAFDRQIARLRRAGAEDDGVEVLQQHLRLDSSRRLRVADELDAFLLHQLDAAQRRLPACRASCSGCRT